MWRGRLFLRPTKQTTHCNYRKFPFVQLPTSTRPFSENTTDLHSLLSVSLFSYHRTIATATRPCLKKNRRFVRKRSKKAKPASPEGKRLAKLQELTEQGLRIPPARKAKPCPFAKTEELVPPAEYDERLAQLYKGLDDQIENESQIVREWVEFDVGLILLGRLSNKELFERIDHSLMQQIESKIDRKRLRDVKGWHSTRSVEDFVLRLSSTLSALSDETKSILEEGLQLPSEDDAPIDSRILETKLFHLGTQYAVNFYHEKRDLMTSLKVPMHSETRGESMLPTIQSGSLRFGLPLRPTKDVDVLKQLEVGDVVTFLFYLPNGETRFFGKRIAGLPGDHVETIDGRVVKVPDGCFWALGDNPEESTDSRHFGAVPASNLRCKILVVYTEDTVTDPPRLRFRVL